MKCFFITAVIFFSLNSFAQVPGKRSKTPFTAIDGHTYNLGDTVKFGNPSLCEWGSCKFEFVYVPANIITGTQKVEYNSNLTKYSVIIERFSISSDNTVYAVFTHIPIYPHEQYKPLVKAIINFNQALQNAEIISKNPYFIPTGN